MSSASNVVGSSTSSSLKQQQQPSVDKALELLNTTEGFLTIRRANDLVIGLPYLVVSAEVKKSSYGRRMALVLRPNIEPGSEQEEEESDFLLYLGQSFVESRKAAALQSILAQPSRALYIELVKIRTDLEFPFPIYKFHNNRNKAK